MNPPHSVILLRPTTKDGMTLNRIVDILGLVEPDEVALDTEKTVERDTISTKNRVGMKTRQKIRRRLHPLDLRLNQQFREKTRQIQQRSQCLSERSENTTNLRVLSHQVDVSNLFSAYCEHV